MPIPRYYELYHPILDILKDGKIHSYKDIKENIIKILEIKDEDRIILVPSGSQLLIDNRIGWARTYLKKAGLINSPARAQLIITDIGYSVLKENPLHIDDKYLMKFDSFANFKNNKSDNFHETNDNITPIEDTPDDILEKAYQQINAKLADDILTEVLKLSPYAFERFVIDLLSKMGYGAFKNAGYATVKSGDEGIDGVIREDKLGFNLIYIQTKRYDVNNQIGRPDLQAFVGAISGKGGKGLFITTSSFSQKAKEYAKIQHIILIDGTKLAELMIEYNFGANTKKVYEIKSIDTDIYNDYQD